MADFISIDWDFFLYNGVYEEEITALGRDGKPTTYPGVLVYDWGHNESHNSSVGEVLWLTRWEQFKRMGLDPIAMTGLREPDLETFLAQLPSAPLGWYADSHAYGYFPAHWFRADHILSFDAHHDLGYGNKTEAARAKQGEIHCDNWLAVLVKEGAAATIVYPDWRGLAETEGVDWKNRLGAARHRVRFTTWSEWLAEHPPLKPGGIFACRSSAWTPPWWDHEFARLIACLPVTHTENLDETHSSHSLAKIGAYDAGTPREWDMEAAEAHVEMMKSLVEEVGSGERLS